ncbi:MAG: DUF1015 domain-containing protein [Gemmatimonadales bacterium]
MRFRPFRAWRPKPSIVPRVACPPYDVVTRAEALALAAGNPLSFLHVVRSDIDLPESVDPHDARVYAKAKDSFAFLMRDGFVEEGSPSVFLYEITLEGRTQLGVVGCVHVDEYESGVIRKHEATRSDKEDDRTRHILTLGAHAEPVLLAHQPTPYLTRLNQATLETESLFDYTTAGVRHRGWKVADPVAYADGFRRVPAAYIADGHHRSAGAWRAAAERKAHNPRHSGAEEYNWFLAVLFPATQLRILPYHRVVRDLAGLTPEGFLSQLLEVGQVEPTDRPEPERTGSFGVLVGNRWFRLTLPGESVATLDPLRALDAALLQARILEPILKIGDLRTDVRVGFVGGLRGIAELERLVGSGEMAAGFALHPVSMDQLMRFADGGLTMPPKSTWLEPKLQSGLFVHLLD